ncbi:hypothetical protein HDU98_009450 [Podochytrium sp. JEL0797]|nr:hypothetical protein HDU98_009450 [Podochytrium sp. JEL0797]
MQSSALALLLAAASASAATYNIVAIPGAPAPFQGVPTTNLNIGDVLAFDLGGNHAVVDVTQDLYNSCAVSATTVPAIGLTSGGQATPGFSYTFGTAGTYYIVCPIGGGYHCNAGMKFQVTVNPANQPLIPVPVPSSSAPDVPIATQPALTSIQTTQGAPASTVLSSAAGVSQASAVSTASAAASAATTTPKAAAITSDAASFSFSLVSSALLMSLFV